MKAFNNYESAKEAATKTGSEQLPVGAYICVIKNVQFQEGQNGNSDLINILFDIAEGEQKDFFKKQYEANTSEDKKWKGRTTIWVPKDDGSEKDEWTKNSFARWTLAFEKSNNGYAWDWDENKWKGKKIGLVFGPTGTVIDRKEITYTEVHGPCSVEEVKTGKFWNKLLELRKKNGFTGNTPVATTSDDFMTIAENSPEDIPF